MKYSSNALKKCRRVVVLKLKRNRKNKTIENKWKYEIKNK
jgi:hypothetical protein